MEGSTEAYSKDGTTPLIVVCGVFCTWRVDANIQRVVQVVVQKVKAVTGGTQFALLCNRQMKRKEKVEDLGIDPSASRMLSERSTI